MGDALFCDALPYSDPYGYPAFPAREFPSQDGFPFPFRDTVEIRAALLGNRPMLGEHVSTLPARRQRL